jgi:hypothetical protein
MFRIHGVGLVGQPALADDPDRLGDDLARPTRTATSRATRTDPRRPRRASLFPPAYTAPQLAGRTRPARRGPGRSSRPQVDTAAGRRGGWEASGQEADEVIDDEKNDDWPDCQI